jgi:hypothetical protein
MSELGIWHIASVCHAAHRALCEALGEIVPHRWDDECLPQFVRHNAMDNARIQIDNPGISPADRHEIWVAKRMADGWTAGVKDPVLKTHPCLVPFHELPEPQQVKGVLFGQIVEALRFHVR